MRRLLKSNLSFDTDRYRVLAIAAMLMSYCARLVSPWYSREYYVEPSLFWLVLPLSFLYNAVYVIPLASIVVILPSPSEEHLTNSRGD